jgi:Uma2 family endonuclease
MQLADLDFNKIYTYADYFKWNIEERVELILGRTYKMGAPSPAHQELSGHVHNILYTWLKGKACKVYTAPFDVRLPGKSADDKDIYTVLQPDICVICDLSKIDKKGCLGAPDIVIEILSPGNNSKELRNKYKLYEQAGVREYWIISPENQTFLKHTLIDSQFVLSPLQTTGDSVTSTVLPGLSFDLANIFTE